MKLIKLTKLEFILSLFGLLLVFLFTFSSFASAYDLSQQDKSFVENVVRGYSSKQAKFTVQIQKNNYQKLSTMLSAIEKKSSNDPRNQGIFGYFNFLIGVKLSELSQVDSGNDLTGTNNTAINYGKYNVNIQKIRDYWLNIHNKERGLKGLDGYNYSPTLEQTAYNWANFLGDNFWTNLNSKTRKYSSHRRKPGDGYYSTDSVKQRFEDQGVSFDGKGTLFTENIGRGYFSCKDSDCTDEVMKSIKTTRDMFMREKASKGVHYRGIIGNYKNIGVGVYIFGNRYVVVTHYGAQLLLSGK